MSWTKTEFERVAAQNERLLREFPWLWAIRNQWFPGCHDIHVLNADKREGALSLGCWFRDEISNLPAWEIWIRVGEEGGFCKVVKVPEVECLSVAGAIKRVLGEGTVLNVVAVTKVGENPAPRNSAPKVYIFREKEAGVIDRLRKERGEFPR